MKALRRFFLLAAFALIPLEATAGVVINEIFYNAPEDLDEVQWLELFNPSSESVNIGGWTIDKGNVFTFPAGTKLSADGFVVVSLNPEQFAKAYKRQSVGPFNRSIKRGGDRLELRDAAGKLVDAARYKDASPWPSAADGASASLERVSPAASGDLAENWASSPLPDTPKPAGTPGAVNAAFSAQLPPIISPIEARPVVASNQPLEISVEVKSDQPIQEVVLLYRTVTPKEEAKESAVSMQRGADGRYAARIPGQPADTLLRYRVRATSQNGAQRIYPHENELRPALSTYVHDQWEPAPISLSILMLGGADRAAAARQAERGGMGFGPFRFGPRPGGPPGNPPGPPDAPPPPPFGRDEGRPPGPPPGGPGFGRGGPPPWFRRPAESAPRPPRGMSTYIHVDTKSGAVELFDFVHAPPREGHPGFIVHFQKDRPFHQQTAVSFIFEGQERPLLMEALAYEVYQRAKQPASLSEFSRLWIDGKLIGYHLLVERPNKGFLRRNKIDDHGNLYKVIWQGQGVVGTHIKKTQTQTDHEDLIAIVGALEKSKGSPDDQWAIIQKNFDVDEVAAYFAINIVLSHWDGFFNNYYSYHDPKRDKWMMFPWDQDRTWGDGMFGDEPLVDLPLNFGSEGAAPPGARQGAPRGFGFGPFGGGPPWWRPGGVFSNPLLANPHFRKIFLARIREILRTNFTEEHFIPRLDQLAKQLEKDAALRATLRGQDAAAGHEELARNVDFLKRFLRGRREYLLKQDELKSADDPR